uniref:AB hydrolase-1 domain-containing protein n=1 Tax=Oryza glumipatula TaxID=40148 RepID=A0A0E0BJ83_9ORYZ
MSSSETTTDQSGSNKQQQRRRHHFILVHGVCHGAWCWYRVATALSSAGHRVTALDMAACGARAGRADEVPSFERYSAPLLDAVADQDGEEKAVVVAHSFGGQSLALAMERHPEKIAVAVFVTATMPAAGKPMSFAFKQLSQGKGPDFFMDCKIGTIGDPQNPDNTFLFEPEYLARRVYQLSPPEKPAEIQRLMVSWNPGTEVRVLQGADHMPMFSKARELSELLMEIANKYS